MASTLPAGDLPSTRHVILVADLSGYHRGFRTLSDSDMAAFLHRFYVLCEEVISGQGGLVIKFLGDAVLAVFNEDASPKAVAAAVSLETYAEALAADVGLEMRLGANIHAGPVVLSELGTGPSRRLDVIGRTVNQTFLLGRGAGIRISERAYRGLPSSDRSPWEKNKPPAVYLLGASDEPYSSLRKSAAENAARW
jgi:class 3 adenylate cyclase